MDKETQRKIMIRRLKYEYIVEGELSLMSTREIYVNNIKQVALQCLDVNWWCGKRIIWWQRCGCWKGSVQD